MTSTTINSCRSCGSGDLESIIDLGQMPLANAYLNEPRAPEATFPLRLILCMNCNLAQLDTLVAPDVMFSNYAYFSSYSSSWIRHARSFAARAIKDFELTQHSFVVEIASNDGYLLKNFTEDGIQVLGIEPAENVAEVAIAQGVPTLVEFFGSVCAERLTQKYGQADLLIANNVLAHVPDINDFVAGLTSLLSASGTLSLEFPHLLRLIEDVQFDTIYHEHYSYLSLQAVELLLERHGLEVIDLDVLPTHGGSLRVLAKHASGAATQETSVENVRQVERRAGLQDLATYQGFTASVEACRESFQQFLEEHRTEQIVGYGAAAKGNTFLNYCSASEDDLQYVADKSPHKQGLFLPGSRIPIVTPESISETQPSHILILPWNLKKEIARELSYARAWGARFVTAVPSLHIHT
jgi:hypothetical protein